MEKPVSRTETTGKVTREIGSFTATSIVIANMIGSGIFTASGIIAGFLPGPWWVLLCWAGGGLIALSGALCYAELSTRMPEEGGEYVYLKKVYHPLLGFLTGWASLFVGFSAPIAASAMGFSEYLFASIRPDLAESSTWIPLLLKKGAAVAIIVLFTSIHYRGIKTGSRIQNTLTAVKVAILVGLALSAILFGRGDWSHLDHPASRFEWTAIGTAMMLVMFSYSGWNASAYIAGELKNPRKTITLSLVAGTSVVLILYLAVNLFILHSLPFTEIRGVVAIVEKASSRAFGDWMGRGLGVMISLALLSSLSAYVIIGPRVYFAMARDRLFLKFAGEVHPRFKVPSTSIAIQGILAILMVMAGSFEELLVYLGFALGIFPWLSVAGLFAARRRRLGESTAVRTPLFPLVPVFFLGSTLTLMIIAYINRPFESSAAVATVLAGIPCYYIWIRTAGKKKR